MTAPLLQNNTKIIQELTLRTLAHQLLDAIDKNNIEKVELFMCAVLKNDVPEISIRLFYNYAQAKNKVKVCEYFKLVLIATYNTTD